MKRVYIAHPLRGDVARNVERVTEICKTLPREIVPLSPLHNFGYLNPETYDQDHAMKLCFGLLSVASELWVYGDWTKSAGCKMEIEYAQDNGIPVVFMEEQS